MKVDPKILEKMESIGILESFDIKKIKQTKRKVPKWLREAVEKNEIVIWGDGDVLDFHKQPLAVLLLNEHFGMIKK